MLQREILKFAVPVFCLQVIILCLVTNFAA